MAKKNPDKWTKGRIRFVDEHGEVIREASYWSRKETVPGPRLVNVAVSHQPLTNPVVRKSVVILDSPKTTKGKARS